MDKEEIDDSILFDLVKDTCFQGQIENPSCYFTLANPLCGDEVTFYLQLNDIGQVEEIKFKSKGCFICKATAAALSKFSDKKNGTKVLELIESFRSEFISGQAASEEIAEFQLLNKLRNYPTRVKCVLLPFETLAGALKGQKI